MEQNFGLEDLSQVRSRRNPLKYLVRVEMASDWFTRSYRSILAEQVSSKIKIWPVETRLRALLEPALNKKRESNKVNTVLIGKNKENKENKGVFVFGS